MKDVVIGALLANFYCVDTQGVILAVITFKTIMLAFNTQYYPALIIKAGMR